MWKATSELGGDAGEGDGAVGVDLHLRKVEWGIELREWVEIGRIQKSVRNDLMTGLESSWIEKQST